LQSNEAGSMDLVPKYNIHIILNAVNFGQRLY
jgi:hypothetical protein